MPFTLQLPNEYGYVLLAVTSSFLANAFHARLTSKARKASGLDYPITYASSELAEKDPKAYAFNCAQRAHANFTENHSSAMAAIFISGLRYPTIAAALGAGWVLCRIIYATGYVSRGPSGRMVGAIGSSLCAFTLKCLALYTGVMMVMEN